jgi:hypothetical protein
MTHYFKSKKNLYLNILDSTHSKPLAKTPAKPLRAAFLFGQLTRILFSLADLKVFPCLSKNWNKKAGRMLPPRCKLELKSQADAAATM